MTHRPLGDRVLVRRDESPDKVGSIYLPDLSKKAPCRGKVLAVGPGKGDVVWFSRYAGTDLGDEKERLTVMREDDILTVEE